MLSLLAWPAIGSVGARLSVLLLSRLLALDRLADGRRVQEDGIETEGFT